MDVIKFVIQSKKQLGKLYESTDILEREKRRLISNLMTELGTLYYAGDDRAKKEISEHYEKRVKEMLHSDDN